MKGKKIEWFFLLFIRGTVLCSKYLVLPSIIEATLFVNALCNATVHLFGFEYVGCLFYLQPCELVLSRGTKVIPTGLLLLRTYYWSCF